MTAPVADRRATLRRDLWALYDLAVDIKREAVRLANLAEGIIARMEDDNGAD